jgi:NlpC/P60 family
MTINSLVSDYAVTLIGIPYLYGGYKESTGWDCSGCVNNILGIRFGLLLPEMGATHYTGTDHGPSSGQYRYWRLAETVERSAVTAGDLLVWKTHVGVALDTLYMLSAVDPHYGTTVTPIDGFGPQGEALICRHVTVAVLCRRITMTAAARRRRPAFRLVSQRAPSGRSLTCRDSPEQLPEEPDVQVVERGARAVVQLTGGQRVQVARLRHATNLTSAAGGAAPPRCRSW